MESKPSFIKDLSVFPPDDEDHVLCSDQCACCKLSRNQGTFFALDRHTRGFRPWEANGIKFRVAAVQGCRRCGLVLEVALTYMNAMGLSDLQWLRVWNVFGLSGVPRARVRISLNCAEFSGSRVVEMFYSPGKLTSYIKM